MLIVNDHTLSFHDLDRAVRLVDVDLAVWSECARPLFEAATMYGLDSLGVAAQFLKETGNAKFRNRTSSAEGVTKDFRNPCGLKVPNITLMMTAVGTTNEDHPAVHYMFPSWYLGFLAMCQHLFIYAGRLIPRAHLVVDPRAHLVNPTRPARHFRDLGGAGSWGGSVDYGKEVEAKAAQIAAMIDVEIVPVGAQ